MTTRKRGQKKRDDPPTQNVNTQQRVKRRSEPGIIDLKAKNRRPRIKMRSLANTRSTRSGRKVAAKAGRRASAQKAERKDTRTELTRKELGPEVKKRKNPLIKQKTKLNTTNLVKSIKMIQKEEMVKELGQSHEARTEKAAADLAAGTGIGALREKLEIIKTTDGTRTETGQGIAAKVGTDRQGTPGGESLPGAENIKGGVQIEIRLETLTGAGGPEAGVIRKILVRTDLLIGRIGSGNLATTKDDTVAPIAREIKERAERVQNVANPKTREAQKGKSQIVQKAETDMTIKETDTAQALTATKMAGPIS